MKKQIILASCSCLIVAVIAVLAVKKAPADPVKAQAPLMQDDRAKALEALTGDWAAAPVTGENGITVRKALKYSFKFNGTAGTWTASDASGDVTHELRNISGGIGKKGGFYAQLNVPDPALKREDAISRNNFQHYYVEIAADGGMRFRGPIQTSRDSKEVEWTAFVRAK